MKLKAKVKCHSKRKTRESIQKYIHDHINSMRNQRLLNVKRITLQEGFLIFCSLCFSFNLLLHLNHCTNFLHNYVSSRRSCSIPADQQLICKCWPTPPGASADSICASYFSLNNMLLKILQYVYSSCPTAIHFATQHVAHHFTYSPDTTSEIKCQHQF